MDTREIKVKKLKLRDEITNSIRRFQQETECIPEIDVSFIRIEKLGGTIDAFPDVKIVVYLD